MENMIQEKNKEFRENLKEDLKSKGLKYWVLHMEQFIDSLSDKDLYIFGDMLNNFAEYRVSMNKTEGNNYWVVNKDDTPIDNLEDFLKAVKADNALKRWKI